MCKHCVSISFLLAWYFTITFSLPKNLPELHFSSHLSHVQVHTQKPPAQSTGCSSMYLDHEILQKVLMKILHSQALLLIHSPGVRTYEERRKAAFLFSYKEFELNLPHAFFQSKLLHFIQNN